MRRISIDERRTSAANPGSCSDAIQKRKEFLADQIIQGIFQTEALTNVLGRGALVNPDLMELGWMNCSWMIPFSEDTPNRSTADVQLSCDLGLAGSSTASGSPRTFSQPSRAAPDACPSTALLRCPHGFVHGGSRVRIQRTPKVIQPLHGQWALSGQELRSATRSGRRVRRVPLRSQPDRPRAPTIQPPNHYSIDFATTRRREKTLPKFALNSARPDLFYLSGDTPAALHSVLSHPAYL
jgi:hypothetical protein